MFNIETVAYAHHRRETADYTGFSFESLDQRFSPEIFRATDTKTKTPMIKTDDLWNNLKLFELAETDALRIA